MACDARRDRTARRGGRRVDREAMELATWYHDANCEIARDYNEDRSAQLAREMLSSSPIRDEVARLVLVTKTHKCAPTCRCSAASRGGIGPTRRRSGRLRPRAPRRARPPQSHRRDRRTEGLVEFTCITLVSLVDNFLHMSVFRTREFEICRSVRCQIPRPSWPRSIGSRPPSRTHIIHACSPTGARSHNR